MAIPPKFVRKTAKGYKLSTAKRVIKKKKER